MDSLIFIEDVVQPIHTSLYRFKRFIKYLFACLHIGILQSYPVSQWGNIYKRYNCYNYNADDLLTLKIWPEKLCVELFSFAGSSNIYLKNQVLRCATHINEKIDTLYDIQIQLRDCLIVRASKDPLHAFTFILRYIAERLQFIHTFIEILFEEHRRKYKDTCHGCYHEDIYFTLLFCKQLIGKYLTKLNARRITCEQQLLSVYEKNEYIEVSDSDDDNDDDLSAFIHT